MKKHAVSVSILVLNVLILFLNASVNVEAEWDNFKQFIAVIASAVTANTIPKSNGSTFTDSNITDDGSDISMSENLIITKGAANQLKIAYDAASYFTMSVADAGAVTFDDTSDGTAGFTLNDPTSIVGVFTNKYDAAAYWTATVADGAGVTFDAVSDGTANFTLSDPVSMETTSANALVEVLRVVNLDEPDDGEADQAAGIYFGIMKTENNGTSFEEGLTGYIAGYKLSASSDWYCGDTSCQDGGLEFGTANNGTITARATLSHSGYFTATNVVSDGIMSATDMFLTSSPNDPGTANYITIGNTGMYIEGATNDGNELFLNWPNIDVGADTYGYVGTVYLTTDVSNPPTDAELDAIYGAPGTVGRIKYIINDAGANANWYLCISDGTSWWYFTATKAV